MEVCEDRKQDSRTYSEDVPRQRKQRIFVRFELKEITNIGTIKTDAYLELTHSRATLYSIFNEPTEARYIPLTNKEKWLYAMIIDQDDIEAANHFAEEQLCILLKCDTNLDQCKADVNIDYQTENRTYLAKGFIDILELFANEQVSIQTHVLLYPPRRGTGSVAYKTSWNVSTNQPLMRKLHITNLAFISLESIYNVNDELLELADKLSLDVYFQSKIPNEDKTFDEYRICTFSVLRKNIIINQSIHMLWEKIRIRSRKSSPDIRTGCTTRPQSFLKDLLCTEGTNFNLHDINILSDYALTSNSTVRFALTDELTEIIERAIGLNEQRLLIKVYNVEGPQNTLLEGALEVPIFLYPNVNACRFAVELVEPSVQATALANEKTSFATLSISFLSPITESHHGSSIITQPFIKVVPDEEHKYVWKLLPGDQSNLSEKRENTYRKFDQEIRSIAMYILKNNVTDLNENKSFVCCELEILTERISRFFAYDFNVRFPTKDNIEFTNLMTLVYKELTQRIYNILKTLDKKVDTCDADEMIKIIRKMSYVKMIYESGDRRLADFLFNKFSRQYESKSVWHFFNFLYDMERHNFDAAIEYLKHPPRYDFIYDDRHYYTELADIYINYIKLKANEQSSNEALIYILEKLNEFLARKPLEMEPWILLYSLYKMCGYIPGMEFTRLKYENLNNNKQSRIFPQVPYSRFSICNDVVINFHSKKGKLFFPIVRSFLLIGAYKFADIVFDAVADDCTEVETYLFKSTVKILTNDVAANCITESYSGNESTKVLVAFINGNIEYHRGKTNAALNYYKRIMNTKNFEFQCLKLGLLRYAHHLYNERNYLDAIKVYEKYLFFGTGALVAYCGLGKAMYWLNRLQESEVHFLNATKYRIHIPDVWAYLALVSLKLGKTENALKLWRYAKIQGDEFISEEIFFELKSMDHNMLDLFI